MRTGLPSSGRSIVTSYASPWRNPKVLEHSATPSHRSVATITGHGGRNVRNRLSLGRAVVVTLPATSWDYPVVRKKCRHPIRGAVTTVAIECSWQMRCRFKRGDDTPSRCVTLKALLGGPSKQPLQMTAFTLHLCMPTAQRKTCCRMISFNIRTYLGLDGARGHPGQYRQQRGKPNLKRIPSPNLVGCHRLNHFYPFPNTAHRTRSKSRFFSPAFGFRPIIPLPCRLPNFSRCNCNP